MKLFPRWFALFAVWSALLLALAPEARAQKTGKEKAASPGTLAEDRGTFRVVVDGQPVAVEEFQITRSGSEWMARATVEIPGPNGVSKLTSKLRLGAGGAPIQYEYEWAPQGDKRISSVVQFEGGTAHMEMQTEGARPFSQDFTFDSPLVVILDNNLHHHYAILARLYDWEKKGSQTFPVLVPQTQTPGTITVEWVDAQGKVIGTSTFSPGSPIRLGPFTAELLDADGKVIQTVTFAPGLPLRLKLVPLKE